MTAKRRSTPRVSKQRPPPAAVQNLLLASLPKADRDRVVSTLDLVPMKLKDLLHKPDAHRSILERFHEGSSSARGRQVRVEENGGFEGVTEGLDPRGFLQVRTAQGMRTVLSGTVRLKEQSSVVGPQSSA